MKKFLSMFAFLLCATLAFTSCSPEEEENAGNGGGNTAGNGGGNTEWVAGLDESGAPDELVVRYEIDGTKATIVAEFEDGACVKATMIVEVYGYETSTDMTSTYKGYNYEFVKATFEALVNSAE